jgi:DNA repair protein RadC
MKNIELTDSQLQLMKSRFELKKSEEKFDKLKEEYPEDFREFMMLQEQECENWTCGEIQLKYQEIKRPIYSIVSAKDAYNVIKNSADMDSAGIQEHFWAIYISNNGDVIGFRTICTGQINSVEINVQLVLSIAIILNSQRIIISHSHPSGNLRPSLADVDFTKRFVAAARLLSIVVADHLIVTKNDYCSLRDAHFVDFDFVLNYYEKRKYEITDNSILAFPINHRVRKSKYVQP